MIKEFTQNQQRALDISKERNISVSASAGTGKTTVLVERILRLLVAKKTSVDRLLVVTFTKLAATEMKERLKESLSDYLDNAFLAEQAQKLDMANISTIHAFCSELLKSYFYVINIDPNFSVAEDGIADELKDDALNNVLENELLNHDETFVKLMEMLGKKREHAYLKQVIFRLYSFFVCRPDFDEWFNEKKEYYTADEENNPFLKALDADLKSSVNVYRRALEDISRKAFDLGATEAARYAQTVAASISLPDRDGYRQHITRLGEAEIPTFTKKIKDNLADTPDLLQRAEKTIKKLRNFISKQTEKFNGESVDVLLEHCRSNLVYVEKIADLLNKLDREFFRLKQSKNLLDYNDLERLTLKLLENEQVRQEICDKYEMIFVDEFQDVNGVQDAIIERLRRKKNLFVVGDIKQSIYGFRQSEPQIFVEKTSSFLADSDSEVIYMNDNFRSDTQILDFVNLVFSDLMTMKFGKTDYVATGEFCGEKRDFIEGVCPINIDCITSTKQSKPLDEQILDIWNTSQKDSVCHAQARLVASHIKELVGKKTTSGKTIGYGDIVILMRSLRAKAKILCDVLTNCGIPIVASLKNEDLGKEIKDLLNFLKVLDNPLDDIPFAGALMGWFGGVTAQDLATVAEKTNSGYLADRVDEYCAKYKDELSDKLARFVALREKYEFLSKCVKADRLVSELAYSTGYDMFVLGLPNGNIRRNNLNRFVKCSKGADGMLCDFLKYFDKIGFDKENSASDGVNAVRVMSMHASKGLEFPVVILPCLEADFVLDFPSVSASIELGIAMDYYDFDSREIFSDIAHSANFIVNVKKQTEEELRLLYVALTRAKNHLFIVGAGEDYLTHDELFIPSAAKNAFSWIMYSLTKERDLREQRATYSVGETVKVVPMSIIENNALVTTTALDKKTDVWEDFVYPFGVATTLDTKVTASSLGKMNSPVFSSDFSSEIMTKTLDGNSSESRAKLGTAYHKILEKSDFSETDLEKAKQTLDMCVAEGWIEEQTAKEVDLKKITDCLSNPQLQELVLGGKVYHELPFLVTASFDELGLNDKCFEQTILQGIADMVVVKDDKAIVVDFKFTKRPDKIKENYTLQLKAYALAVKKILDKPVEIYVLSIDNNKLLKIV